MEFKVLELNPLRLADEPEPEVCKGLIFRGRVNVYISPTTGAYIETKSMVPLIRQTCTGCEKCYWLHDFMDEDLGCLDYKHFGDSLFADDVIVDGGTYQYMVTGTSTDWETGIVDDVECGFVKIDKE